MILDLTPAQEWVVSCALDSFAEEVAESAEDHEDAAEKNALAEQHRIALDLLAVLRPTRLAPGGFAHESWCPDDHPGWSCETWRDRT